MKNYITPSFELEVVEDMIVTSVTVNTTLFDLPNEDYVDWESILG